MQAAAGWTSHPWRHNNVGSVTAGQVRHNSSNVGGVTAGQMGHNSSKSKQAASGRVSNIDSLRIQRRFVLE